MSQHSRKLSKLKLNQIKIGSQNNQITKFLKTSESCIENNEITVNGQLRNGKRLNNKKITTECVSVTTTTTNESMPIDECQQIDEDDLDQEHSIGNLKSTIKDDSLCHFQTPDKRLLRKRPILNYTNNNSNNNNNNAKKKRSSSNKRSRSKQQDIRKIIEKQKQLTADELYENLLMECNNGKTYINREQFEIELAIKQSKINHDDDKVKNKINLDQFKYGNGKLESGNLSANPFFNLKRITKQKWSKSITPLTLRNPIKQREKLHKHINEIMIKNSKSLKLIVEQKEDDEECSLELKKPTFTCSSYYLKQYHSMDNRIFSKNSMGNDHRTKDCMDKFYINGESQFTQSTIKCGSLLKNWNSIPGRDKSPIRNITETAVDAINTNEICENVNVDDINCCVQEIPNKTIMELQESECNSYSKQSPFDRSSSSCELFDDSVMQQDDIEDDENDKVPNELSTTDRLCIIQDNVLETDQGIIDGDASSISTSSNNNNNNSNNSSSITSNKNVHTVYAEIHNRLDRSSEQTASDILIDLTNEDSCDIDEFNKSQNLNGSPLDIRKLIDNLNGTAAGSSFQNESSSSSSSSSSINRVNSALNLNKFINLDDKINELSIINQQNEMPSETFMETNEMKEKNCIDVESEVEEEKEDKEEEEAHSPMTPNLSKNLLSMYHNKKFIRLMEKSKKLIDFMNISATPSPSSSPPSSSSSSPFRQRCNSDDLTNENNSSIQSIDYLTKEKEENSNSIQLLENKEKENSIQINNNDDDENSIDSTIIDLTDECELLPIQSASISNLIKSKLLQLSTDNLSISSSSSSSQSISNNDKLTTIQSFENDPPEHTENPNQSLIDILEKDEELFKKCTIINESTKLLKRTISDCSLLQPQIIANKKLKKKNGLSRNQSFGIQKNFEYKEKENCKDTVIKIDELPTSGTISLDHHDDHDDDDEDRLENELQQFIKNDIDDNDKFIIKIGRCVTPKPNYERMTSPERLIELKKYGIKIQKKRQAIICLEHIYNQLHPFIELPAKLSTIINNVKEKNLGILDDNQFVDVDQFEVDQLENSSDNKNNSSISENYCNSIDGNLDDDDDDDDAEQYLIKSQTNVLPPQPINDNQQLSIVNLQIGTGDMLINDKRFLRLHNKQMDNFILPVQPRSKKISWCLLPLHIAWHNLLSANPQLYEIILQYKPVNLKEIRNFFKKIHLQFELKDMVAFFDHHCVAFRTERCKIK